jgi:hypothetical protein
MMITAFYRTHPNAKRDDEESVEKDDADKNPIEEYKDDDPSEERNSGTSTAQVNDVRREMAGLQRKILGIWRQYSSREFPGFFPVDSDKFQWLPAGSSDFRASFLQDPARSGGRNDRPG